MKKTFISILIILLLVFSIFKIYNSEEKYQFSYYFWESSYNNNIENSKAYIKFLDISYSNRLEIIKTSLPKELKNNNIIPVVYITNKTMQNISYLELSKKILALLDSYKLNFDEIQIDCDWSLSTRENLFLLLKELKKTSNKTLSTTIRLHQIKYFDKTGVPPVDYGVLMYYNMSDIKNFNTKNYILDNNVAKNYHYNFDKYPLKLKLALPLYSQAVQFRDNKIINLIENVTKDDFNQNFQKLEDNKYLVLKSNYFKGQYIYKGDILRFEFVEDKELKKAFDDFKKLSKNHFKEIIFYTYKYKNWYNLQKIINNQ